MTRLVEIQNLAHILKQVINELDQLNTATNAADSPVLMTGHVCCRDYDGNRFEINDPNNAGTVRQEYNTKDVPFNHRDNVFTFMGYIPGPRAYPVTFTGVPGCHLDGYNDDLSGGAMRLWAVCRVDQMLQPCPVPRQLTSSLVTMLRPRERIRIIVGFVSA